MPNDKSPGNDDLTKEFFETFQRQAIIKLIQKKKINSKLEAIFSTNC